MSRIMTRLTRRQASRARRDLMRAINSVGSASLRDDLILIAQRQGHI